MRIHQILETCLEYVAYDGIVGSDPAKLIQHLTKLDPSLDYDYFSHIWSLLFAHPSIEVVLSTYPLHSPGGTTYDGTAPLPSDYVPVRSDADVDISLLFKEGVRGRQLAFMLAGEEYRTDRQAIEDKRLEQERIRQAKRKRAEEEGGVGDGAEENVKAEENTSDLLRVLNTNDDSADEHGGPIEAFDLKRLWARWGPRLRLRCTEDEIYYRLTGSHQKISKITSTVFHVLQLSAMSREQGITAIELGPSVGASQGSMHYFMKVLVGMGLCTKVPAVIHGAITNLLIFHKFLDQNPNYRALVGKEPTNTNASIPIEPVLDAEKEDEDEDVNEEGGDPLVDDSIPISEWGLNFGPLAEAELSAGHVVKQRILKILDHPKLKNHLLRTKNLLNPLGWQGVYLLRHTRALKRHIDKLVDDDQVQRVSVGDNGVICIRLPKYDPESTTIKGQTESGAQSERNVMFTNSELDLEVIASQPPYSPPGGIALTLSFEYLINELIARAGLEGATIKTLWRNTAFMYKRSIDFAIIRADNAPIPSHLWSLSMSSVMETIGKERRLRLFSTEAYQEIMLATGQPLSGYSAKPRPADCGRWGDVSLKQFFSSIRDISILLNSGKLNDLHYMSHLLGKRPTQAINPPKPKVPKVSTAYKIKSVKDKVKGKGKEKTDTGSSGPGAIDDGEEGGGIGYTIGQQTRGRPRKYIHVVEEDGKVNRKVIGSIPSRDDLPPILIYLKEKRILVEAPPEYNGLGAPPTVTEEAIEKGHPPEWYFHFPTKDPAVGRAQWLANQNPQNKDKDTDKDKKKKSSKKRKVKEGEDGNAPTSPAPARKSKRARKDIDYKEKKDVDAVEELQDGIIVIDEDDVVAVDPSAQLLSTQAEQHSFPDPSDPIATDTDNDLALRAIAPPETSATRIADLPQNIDDSPRPNKKAQSKKAEASASKEKPAKGKKAKGKRGTVQIESPVIDLTSDSKVQAVPSVVDQQGEGQPIATTVASPLVIGGEGQGSVTAALSLDPSTSPPVAPVDRPAHNTNPISAIEEPTTAKKGRKRKSVAVSPAPTSSPAPKSKKKRATAAGAGPRASMSSMFDFEGSGSMMEMPFELPDDIMLVTTPSKSSPQIDKSTQEILMDDQPAAEHVSTEVQPAPATSNTEQTPFELPFEIIEAATPIREKRSKQDSKKGTKAKSTKGKNKEHQTKLTDLIPKLKIETSPVAPVNKLPSERPVEPSPHILANSTETPDIALSTPPVETSAPPAAAVSGPTVAADATADVNGAASTTEAEPASPLQEATAPSLDDDMVPPPSASMDIPYIVEQLTNASGRKDSIVPSPRERSTSQTPLRHLTEKAPTPHRSLAQLSDPKLTNLARPRTGRVDIGLLRRAEELHQTLVDGGGASIELKIGPEHRLWAERVAGTDYPNAPKTAYTMDRTTIRKTIRMLVNDGRLKETSVSTPTSTGRWIKTHVIYLSSVAQADLQAYIRQMSSTLQQNSAPTVKISATLADTQFTEVPTSQVRGAGKPHTVVASGSKKDAPILVNEDGQVRPTRPISDRRMALLQEINVVAQLYGWKSGRCVRAHCLHRSIIEAFIDTSQTTSILSNSPRIFALPMLFEEISVDAYFSCILSLQYDEDLDYWLQDPDHRKLKVKDIPQRLRPHGGFSGHAAKNKMATLLEILMQLKIISPLSLADEGSAQVLADNSKAGISNGYNISTGETWATYFLVHDHAPVYHLAAEDRALLGTLPTETLDQCDRFWSTVKIASLEKESEKLLGVEKNMDELTFPALARLPETLSIPVDQLQMLQYRTRWKNEFHLLPIQKEALDSTINNKTGERYVTDPEAVYNLAYENALPPSWVESELDRRSQLAKEKATKRAMKIEEHVVKSRERQEQIQESLRGRMLERQKADLEALSVQVRNSTRRLNIEYDENLLDFVRRQTALTHRRMELTDAQVDIWTKMWDQTKNMSKEEREDLLAQRRSQALEKARARIPRASRTKFVPANTTRRRPGATGQKRTRTKRRWTTEDDDLIIDAEAIIRARSRNTKYIGRAAMSQIYPTMSAQTFTARIRKIKSKPGISSYLERLEDAWFHIWTRYRGSDILKDDQVDSPIEFDLKEHIEFLNEKVDKRSLRLFANSTPAAQVRIADLPMNIDEIIKASKWNYLNGNEYAQDDRGDPHSAEEIRVSHMASVSMFQDTKPSLSIPRSTLEEDKSAGMLSTAVKMVVATPSAIYDAMSGEKLLRPWSAEQVDYSIADLVNNSTLKKVPSTSATAGRSYDFTSQWYQSSEGSLPQELIHDAEHLSKKLSSAEDGEIDWPLIGKGGELAALMNMVSNHQVDITFDAAEIPALKYEKDHYNTRKLNDDVYEFDLRVKRKSTAQVGSTTTSVSLPPLDRVKLPTAWSSTLVYDENDQRLAERITRAILVSSSEGMTIPILLSTLECSQASLQRALSYLSLSQDRKEEVRVFWAGYDTARLIPIQYSDGWMIGASRTVVPRRWSDIYGEMMKDEWDKCVNLVLTMIINRPGMSHRSLRDKLSSMLNRMELIDICDYLQRRGDIIAKTVNMDMGMPIETVDIDQEGDVTWYINIDKLWMQL